MGISITWFELDAGTLERWARDPVAADERLCDEWHRYFEDPEQFTPSAPFLRVVHFDYKARVGVADAHGCGDQVADAIQGDVSLAIGRWPLSFLRAYSRAYLVARLADLPDDPEHLGHDLRTAIAAIVARGSELVSLWS